jgi:hypothetical protein
MTGNQRSEPLDAWLDDVYVGQERLTRGEIHRHATADDLPAGLMARVDALPEGEYAQDEAAEALRQVPELIPETGEADAA